MSWLKCLHVGNGTALVKSNRSGKSFPVTIQEEIKFLVHQGDYLQVIKSNVTGEWTAIDYMAMIGGDLQ
ncbi:MAG: hypothetical protein IJ258_11270 [Methanobrevibacter sp.]|uniref:hypothetical protein n=1 Tax=Methanobrevibacter sp. TaxID=66852 RepID=UPI0025F6F899|nr:hypothetical protein [Methanobrevibacter sp.]MBQ8018658.1 hypothetical protein [Methanobrevibacter sp.]